MLDSLTCQRQHRCFDGILGFYSHASAACHCPMRFAVYLPPQAQQHRVPVLYFLSGLTCTEETFMIKAGAQRYAAQHGLALVAPDTSPRGCNLPGEDDSWEIGTGAGFYVNATQMPWVQHYQMYDYVVQELPQVIAANFPVIPDQQSIFGHSMGGYGALTIALKNPGRFKSVSAFSPIVAPSQVPWGQQILGAYLGNNQADWLAYDPTDLVRTAAERLPILIDQGEADEFLEEQLRPHLFAQACAEVNHPLTLRRHPGYDHGYFFVSSFMADHLAHHAAALV